MIPHCHSGNHEEPEKEKGSGGWLKTHSETYGDGTLLCLDLNRHNAGCCGCDEHNPGGPDVVYIAHLSSGLRVFTNAVRIGSAAAAPIYPNQLRWLDSDQASTSYYDKVMCWDALWGWGGGGPISTTHSNLYTSMRFDVIGDHDFCGGSPSFFDVTKHRNGDAITYYAIPGTQYRVDFRREGGVKGMYRLHIGGADGAFKLHVNGTSYTSTSNGTFAPAPAGADNVAYIECVGAGSGWIGYSFIDKDGIPRYSERLYFNAIGIEIAQKETYKLWTDTNSVSLTLTHTPPAGDTITWTVSPSGLNVNTSVGNVFKFTPSGSESKKYTVTAKSTKFPSMQDECMVIVAKVGIDNSDAKQFVPGVETQTVTYTISPASFELNANSIKAEVFRGDADSGTPIRTVTTGLQRYGTSTWGWDGKLDNGTLATPTNYTVKISIGTSGSQGMSGASTNVAVEVHSFEYVGGGNIYANFTTGILDNHPTNLYAIVKLKSKNGTGIPSPVPFTVHFTATEGSGNATTNNAFQYATGYFLGKKGDTNAHYWASAPKSVSVGSTNGYWTTAYGNVVTTDSNDLGRAYMAFLPSGVGGDTFTLRANLTNIGETNILRTATTNVVVWRSAYFDRRRMGGETHIDDHATATSIRPYFETATRETYMRYDASASVSNLSSAASVKYIGLWTNDTVTGVYQRQDWAAKLPSENPSAQQWTNAIHCLDLLGNTISSNAQTQAQAAIRILASNWVVRVEREFLAMEDRWVIDNAPADTVIAIQYYHPKYSPEPDRLTSEWDKSQTDTWLKFPINGTDRHPDDAWGGSFLGTYYAPFKKGQITIAKGYGAKTRCIVAHEVGHATKDIFHRKSFGTGDHSSTAGLMFPTMNTTDPQPLQLNQEEVKILKGGN